MKDKARDKLEQESRKQMRNNEVDSMEKYTERRKRAKNKNEKQK